MSEQKVIVIPEGKICDYIDGKFRNDTPEEYVRQTIEKRLVNEHTTCTSLAAVALPSPRPSMKQGSQMAKETRGGQTISSSL